MRKWQKFLKQHPSLISSSDEIEELPPNVSLEAITKETKSVRTNTTLSLPSAFKGETKPPVDPNSICMPIIPRNCKIDNKITSLPHLFNLKFIESNYVSDPQLSAMRDLVVSQDPDIHENISAMNRYYSQFVNDFSVKENVVWMDEKLVYQKTFKLQLTIEFMPTITEKQICLMPQKMFGTLVFIDQ